MKLTSNQKMILAIATVMAAAAVLAATSLALLYRLQLRVDALAGSGGSPGLSELRQEIFFSYGAVVVVGAIGTAVSLASIFWIGRKVFGVLRNVTHALRESSTALMESADQVAESSGALAEHASQAAASIEETSAALEEMASMTQNNAEHAASARQVASQARLATDAGAADMTALYQAMTEIKAGSDDIAKIVRTIDEIAFQTNILALNAAVEAARAGDAGLGFAVVADEVRSLAQRSASAARETADRIQGALARTEQGVQLAGKVSAGLRTVVEGNQKLDTVAGGVATASAEQSRGIEQLRGTVTQMDRLTQGNATTADQTAEATRVLREQAENVRRAVAELSELSEGANGSNGTNGHRAAATSSAPAAIRSAARATVPVEIVDPAEPEPEAASVDGSGRPLGLRQRLSAYFDFLRGK